MGVLDQRIFMGADSGLPNRVNVINRRTEPNRLHDCGRARLEFVRRLAVSDAILEHLMNHFATTVERGHRRKMLVFAIESADAGWPVKLVASEYVEITVNVANVDVEVHRRLGSVH